MLWSPQMARFYIDTAVTTEFRFNFGDADGKELKVKPFIR
jgi:hypothetical protein